MAKNASSRDASRMLIELISTALRVRVWLTRAASELGCLDGMRIRLPSRATAGNVPAKTLTARSLLSPATVTVASPTAYCSQIVAGEPVATTEPWFITLTSERWSATSSM